MRPRTWGSHPCAAYLGPYNTGCWLLRETGIQPRRYTALGFILLVELLNIHPGQKKKKKSKHTLRKHTEPVDSQSCYLLFVFNHIFFISQRSLCLIFLISIFFSRRIFALLLCFSITLLPQIHNLLPQGIAGQNACASASPQPGTG